VSLYYVIMLAWVGCVADTAEVAAWFGDDIAFRADSYRVNFAGLPMMGFALSHAGAGTPLLHRLRLAADLVLTGGRAVERGLMAHCLSTTQMARRLGLPAEVCEPLRQVFTRWDAKGVPDGVGGQEIARPVRLFHLADTVEVFHRAGGVDAAVDVARARRGKHFDPEVVDLFCGTAREVLADMDAVTECTALIEAEPGLCRQLSERELDSALEAVADFTDLRSPFRAGHSRAVAQLAATAARLWGLPDREIGTVRRAALLHDVGMHGVPASILDKPGPLSGAEAERMRLHSYWTERALARPAALARIGEIASLANERLDGSGYHRGLSWAAIPVTGRILAAADVWHAMSEPRPRRDRRPRCHGGSAQGPRHRHGVPELRPVPAEDGGGEHGLRAEDAARPQGRAGPPGAGGGQAAGSRRQPARPQAQAAVRRPAAAGGHGTGHRARAEGLPDG
jgi:HD-GYP domain-containing protein (c-di-GMP phosphodiesterase class II)